MSCVPNTACPMSMFSTWEVLTYAKTPLACCKYGPLPKNLSAFVQIQDVRLWGSESNTLGDFSADGLDLHQGSASIELKARDDGRGAAEVKQGNGLRGMTERLEQLGGKLKIETTPGAGFALHAWLPNEDTT